MSLQNHQENVKSMTYYKLYQQKHHRIGREK